MTCIGKFCPDCKSEVCYHFLNLCLLFDALNSKLIMHREIMLHHYLCVFTFSLKGGNTGLLNSKVVPLTKHNLGDRIESIYDYRCLVSSGDRMFLMSVGVSLHEMRLLQLNHGGLISQKGDSYLIFCQSSRKLLCLEDNHYEAPKGFAEDED